MTSGKVVHSVSRKRHFCVLPGWWQRRKLDIDYGSIWECECGQRWAWESNWATDGWYKEERFDGS